MLAYNGLIVEPNSATPAPTITPPSITTLWSSSYGIVKNPQISLFFPEGVVKKIGIRSKPKAGDVVVGWGNKPNTFVAKRFAYKNNQSYMRLEDGFIGYLGHPSEDSLRLSLIKDEVGIYYDARAPSTLEQLCHGVFTEQDEARAEALIRSITLVGISKYNHQRNSIPSWLNELADDCVLLVDQTASDQSIECGLADSGSFQAMLIEARRAHPLKPIVIKTHPDVMISGKKKGHYCSDDLPDNVFLLTVDCAIPELMNKVAEVYVVTSQLGFEALLYGKRVHCFGLPFYAGWGLTQDRIQCVRREVELSLAQLVFVSLVQYPTYLHPETQELCEVEQVIDWLYLQLKDGVSNTSPSVDVCYAFGFSLWKRAFVRQFVARMARRVIFVNDASKLETLLQGLGQSAQDDGKKLVSSVLLWGRGRSVWAKHLREYADVWFMEDGFLRSVGLGADLRRPSCLVIDRQGMYYDSSDGSDIITILNNTDLTSQQLERAAALVISIKQHAVTKYNVGTRQDSKIVLSDLRLKAGKREIVVVPGQFENDLSIACSLGKIKTNIALLAQVRADYPMAFIIFKEHPDVYSGVRPGALGKSAAIEFADLYLADIDMDSLLACCDRICTLTSLAGFEALLRNKPVTVYGSPFYAGWGLTTDQLQLPDRQTKLSLNELVYGAMIEYSRYVDWNNGYLTGPEQTVAFLAKQRTQNGFELLNSSWLARQVRKVQYFLDTYFR
jgi:capsular polysaccharide export protein